METVEAERAEMAVEMAVEMATEREVVRAMPKAAVRARQGAARVAEARVVVVMARQGRHGLSMVGPHAPLPHPMLLRDPTLIAHSGCSLLRQPPRPFPDKRLHQR